MYLKCKDCGNIEKFRVDALIPADAVINGKGEWLDWYHVGYENYELGDKYYSCAKCNSEHIEKNYTKIYR